MTGIEADPLDAAHAAIEARLKANFDEDVSALFLDPLEATMVIRTWREPTRRHPHLGSRNQTRAWRPAQVRRGRCRREYVTDLHAARWPT